MPHEVAAREVHEDVPQVATPALLREEVCPHEVSRDQRSLQPLRESGEAPEVVEAIDEPERNARERQQVEPLGRTLLDAAESDDKTEKHRRGTAGLYRGCDPVTLFDEDLYPRRQAEDVDPPCCDTPPPAGCGLAGMLCALRCGQEDFVEEIETSRKDLQKCVQGTPPGRTAACHPVDFDDLLDYYKTAFLSIRRREARRS